ncbi:MAG: hypothetical protein ACK44Q_11645 [Pirellulaceae bacterium]
MGKLVNSTLAACIASKGIDVTDGPFHLSLKCETQDALPCILQAIDDAVDSNPLGTLKPEQLADMGPHFRLLSGIQQQESREDWLDKVFLRHWRDGIETIHDLPIDSEIGLILQQLT